MSDDAMPDIDDSELDPIDELAVPLVLAVGRLVLGAAALEKVLLVDIIMRHFHLDCGWRDEFMTELDDLEKRPAGKLLSRLRDLGIPVDLAKRIEHVIRRRNQVVHHLMEDVKVAIALQTGNGMEDVVADIDRIAIDCQQVVNELTVVAFPNMEAAIGMTLPKLAELIGQIDLTAIEDPQLRQQVEFARLLRDAVNWEPKPGPG